MNLLAITQDILSDMDSDDVNSINDSVEALQVAQIIKTTYYNIVDGKDYAFLYELFQLEASGTNDRPTHMKLPEDIIDLADARDSTATNIKKVTDTTGITINILKDKCPQFFTSFDDEHVVFDSYLATIDTTLQKSKTQCHGKRSVAFTLSDTFIPDLPVQMFTYLLNEAKSACFLTLKQMANQKAEQISITQRRRMSQDAWRIAKGISYPNYGRHSTNKTRSNKY